MADRNQPSILFMPHRQLLGHVEQSVMCLTTDTCLAADPGVACLILARFHTFVEIDHEIISMAIITIDPSFYTMDYPDSIVYSLWKIPLN